MRSILSFSLLGLSLFASTASGQTTQPEIAARLVGKPLFLRGAWEGSKLDFLSDGSPKQPYRKRSFTVSGFDARSVTLKNGSLKIDGKRVGLEFGPQGSVKRVELGAVRLEIEGAPGADFAKALDTVFAPDLESLEPEFPYYWKDIAAKDFVPEPIKKKSDRTKAADPLPGEPLHVGGNVRPPKLLRSSEAVFSPEARSKRYSGDVMVGLVVGKDGSIDGASLKILKAAGLGLDEQALAAAMLYKFAPATRDGEPVKVAISLEVNFQIF